MARFTGLAGTAGRERLDPPSLTPRDLADTDNESSPSGQRSGKIGYYPNSESRVELANRQTVVFHPGYVASEGDSQKGGVPGGSDYVPALPVDPANAAAGLIGPKGVPTSPMLLSWGMADWSSSYPTFYQMHSKIQWQQNPNRPQVNPTPFNLEGPVQNTIYTTPAPWAAGTFIG